MVLGSGFGLVAKLQGSLSCMYYKNLRSWSSKVYKKSTLCGPLNNGFLTQQLSHNHLPHNNAYFTPLSSRNLLSLKWLRLQVAARGLCLMPPSVKWNGSACCLSFHC